MQIGTERMGIPIRLLGDYLVFYGNDNGIQPYAQFALPYLALEGKR